MKIRFKIFLAIFFTSIIGTVSVTVLFYVFGTRSLQDSVSKQIHQIVASKKDVIEIYLTDRVDFVHAMSRVPRFVDVLSLSSQDKGYETELSKAQEYIEEINELETDINNIVLYDKDAQTVASTFSQGYDSQISITKVLDVVQTSKPFHEGIYKCNEDISTCFLYGEPIEKEGTILGVLIVEFNTYEIYSLLNQNIEIGSSGEVYLVNSDGFRISPSRYGEDVILKQKENSDNVKQCIEQWTGNSLLNKEEVREPFSYVNHRGNKTVGQHANISLFSWCLIAEIEESEVYSSINVISWAAIFIMLAYLVLIYLVARIIGTLMSRPLNVLKKGVEIIEKGDLEYKIYLSSRDEFGELARGFNKMADHLKNMYKSLEFKVRDKTQILSTKINELEQNKAVMEETKRAMLNVLEDLENEKSVLEREKAKDEAVLLAIGDGLVVSDNDGNVVLVNKAFERLLGWDKHEVLGKDKYDIIRMESEDGTQVPKKERVRPLLLMSGKKVKAANGTFVTTTADYYYVAKDGNRFPVMTTSTPIVLEDTIIGTVEVFRDVTEEKEIDKAKSEFVSLASHQLRTPLSTIKWYAEMLVSGDAGDLEQSQKEYVQEIYNGNERMIELVNALLNVSRIEMGTLAIEPQPTNIVDLAKSVEDELKNLIEEKKLVFKTNYNPDVPIVSLDPRMMRVVIQNLLTNSVKYTPNKGQVSISIKRHNGSVLIEVADTGCGIPQKQQSKIFTKLFRADNVKERDTGGTGLGLYIAKSIIDQTGGKIWFTSEEDKGTVFYVTIPIQGMKPKKGTKHLT